MTDETLAEILSGRHEPASRADLHAALDDLLDAADADGGRLDGPAFWAFMAALARGRGIADEIAGTAARHIADAGALPDNPEQDPARALAATRMMQWAMLAALVRRVTAYPGEIMPKEFLQSWVIAVADNIVAGKGELRRGEHIDLMGLGTQRGAEWEAEVRAARRLLVVAVHLMAALLGQSVAKTRRQMLPDVPDRTWKDWQREVAKAKRVPVKEVGDDARAEAARPVGTLSPFNLSEADVAGLLRTAWRPR